MINLVENLRAIGLKNLQKKYAININRHKKYPNLVCLKYSHRDSPFNEKIVCQARGIILDEAANWQIVSYPYDKFFNHGEQYAAAIDWNSAKVYDKLDGSLMVLYYYDGRWQVQTSGIADASGEVKDKGVSFCDLFWQVWHELDYQFPTAIDRCFMFELMTPLNRVVVPQKENRLILHGVRNLTNLNEESPELWGNKYNWEVVKTYKFKDFKTVLETAKNLSVLEGEGFIVCDRHYNRQKIKASQYVLLSYKFESLLQGINVEQKMLELIVINESDEFLAYFPDFEATYLKVKNKFDALVSRIEIIYDRYQYISSQKDFAVAVKDYPERNILFGLRNGKITNIVEGLSQLPRRKLQELYFDSNNILRQK